MGIFCSRNDRNEELIMQLEKSNIILEGMLKKSREIPTSYDSGRRAEIYAKLNASKTEVIQNKLPNDLLNIVEGFVGTEVDDRIYGQYDLESIIIDLHDLRRFDVWIGPRNYSEDYNILDNIRNCLYFTQHIDDLIDVLSIRIKGGGSITDFRNHCQTCLFYFRKDVAECEEKSIDVESIKLRMMFITLKVKKYIDYEKYGVGK